MAITKVKTKINGAWYDLSFDEKEGCWKAEIPSPPSSYHQPDGYYIVSVDATNEQGNVLVADGNLREDLRLTVIDLVSPILTIVSPLPLPHYVVVNDKPLVVDVYDDDPGADMSTFSVWIDGVRAEGRYTYTVNANGYRVTWIPSNPYPEGLRKVRAEITDYDGNTGYIEGSFTVDTVPPELEIITNHLIVDTDTIEINGYTTDASTPIRAQVSCGTFSQSQTVKADGLFSFVVPLIEGDNTVTVQVIDAAYWATTKSFLVMRLVTDRTQEDADRLWWLCSIGWKAMSAADREWYMATVCRGGYNNEDMNRANRAMAYLETRLKERGYTPGHTPAGIVWSLGEDIPRRHAQAFLAEVAKFRNVFNTADFPNVPPDMDDFMFGEANDIEKILVEADAAMDRISISAWQSGEAIAGVY